VDIASRNYRLLLAFNVTIYAPLYWPYMFHLVCVERGFTALEFATLKSIYYLGAVALELPGGLLADRLGRRTALIACAAFNTAGCFLYASAFDFWALALAELALACGTALLSGADSALLYDSLRVSGKLERYAEAEGRIKTACFAVFTIGIAASDQWLIPAGGPTLTYTVTGWLSLLGLLAALLLREPAREAQVTVRDVARGALRNALARPKVLRVLAFSTGLYLLARAANATLYDPLLAAQGFPVDRYGTVFVAVSVAGTLASWRTAQWLTRFGERTLNLALLALACSLYAGLISISGPWIAAAFCLQGPLLAILMVATPVVLNREVTAPEHRATLLSLQSVAWRGGYALASPLIGWSLDALSLRQAVIATALLGAVPLLVAAAIRRGQPAPV
jgi:predicted MFS family arabinose efflux permease